MSASPRLALCGGTFDPIHRGHLEPLMSVYERFGWSRVLFIPAYIQPFKTGQESASGFHRFAMAVLATDEDERIEVTPLELDRGEVSYTVDTLEQIRQLESDAVLDWIIGEDHLGSLESWHALERIFQLANFVVLNRGGSTTLPPALTTRVSPLSEKPRSGAILFAKNISVPISATDIRGKLHRGESIRGLVHPRVERYIRRHNLYQSVMEVAAGSTQTH